MPAALRLAFTKAAGQMVYWEHEPPAGPDGGAIAVHASLNSLIDKVYDVPASGEGWSRLVGALERQFAGRVAIFAQREQGVSTLSASRSPAGNRSPR